jgi:hypothetical protein
VGTLGPAGYGDSLFQGIVGDWPRFMTETRSGGRMYNHRVIEALVISQLQ